MMLDVDGVINFSPRPESDACGAAPNSRQLQHVLLAVGNVHANHVKY